MRVAVPMPVVVPVAVSMIVCVLAHSSVFYFLPSPPAALPIRLLLEV